MKHTEAPIYLSYYCFEILYSYYVENRVNQLKQLSESHQAIVVEASKWDGTFSVDNLGTSLSRSVDDLSQDLKRLHQSGIIKLVKKVSENFGKWEYQLSSNIISTALEHFENGKLMDLADKFWSQTVPFHLLEKYPLFVTWKICRVEGDEPELRGCIGNFSALDLRTGLEEYALSSALHDTRFDAITEAEFPLLECSVSLLVDFQPAKNYREWILGLHGIWIEFRHGGRKYSGTFLPEVAREQNWNQEETIDHLLRKAGYHGTINEDTRLAIKLTTYRSIKCTSSYESYLVARRKLLERALG